MKWLNTDARKFLERGYLLPGITVEERIEQICKRAAELLGKKELEGVFHEIITSGWASLSTPVWTNFGLDRGLAISCFGSTLCDSLESILYTQAEVGIMSKYGGGTAAYFGDIRPRGAVIKDNGKSSGSFHFLQMFDSTVNLVSQGSARRGNFAGYQDIFHPDIAEWLDIKTEGNPVQNIFYGVCVPDWWIKEMKEGDREKRKIWAKIIKQRCESGLPYIFFTDNVNNNKPQVYKDKNLQIKHSQLCAEINLPTSTDSSFVCCLSSLNLRCYREWKDKKTAYYMTIFLDAVMEEFIQKSANIKFLERAHKFAKEHRALGLGVLGYHTLLQRESIPFESMNAKYLNAEIFKHIDAETLEASKDMAKEYGEPALLTGYGLRNTTRMAIAPTTSSSFILGQVSPSIEPMTSNYYIKDLQKGKFVYKNPSLKKVLKTYDKDNDETWLSILQKDGSVQHLEFLSKHDKDVFKTFGEISQMEIIVQAAQRQQWIDQGQSLNISIHPDTPPKYINELMLKAHELGIKSLYYQRSSSLSQELGRKLLECKSCES